MCFFFFFFGVWAGGEWVKINHQDIKVYHYWYGMMVRWGFALLLLLEGNWSKLRSNLQTTNGRNADYISNLQTLTLPNQTHLKSAKQLLTRCLHAGVRLNLTEPWGTFCLIVMPTHNMSILAGGSTWFQGCPRKTKEGGLKKPPKPCLVLVFL